MRDKKRRLIHVLLTAALVIPCLFFSIPCTVMVTVTSAVFFVFYELLFAQRRSKVMKLCDNIDRILRSDDL